MALNVRPTPDDAAARALSRLRLGGPAFLALLALTSWFLLRRVYD